MDITYRKKKSQRIGDVEIEYWHAFREFGKVVYREGTTELEFDAEWLGWGWFDRHFLGVVLPQNHSSLAATIRQALRLMRIDNEVTSEQAVATFGDWKKRSADSAHFKG